MGDVINTLLITNNKYMNKIKKGDKVKMMVGKDSGREGVVDRVLVGDGQIFVSGVNMVKRHINAKRFGQEKGSVVDMPKPVNLSNVMLVCPNCHQPTRVGFVVSGDSKNRVCRKCGKEIIK